MRIRLVSVAVATTLSAVMTNAAFAGRHRRCQAPLLPADRRYRRCQAPPVPSPVTSAVPSVPCSPVTSAVPSAPLLADDIGGAKRPLLADDTGGAKRPLFQLADDIGWRQALRSWSMTPAAPSALCSLADDTGGAKRPLVVAG